MDTIEAIFTRRSIRHFNPQPIPEEDVEKLLRAAMQAPSSNNEQPWHFIVVTDRHTLDSIPTFHSTAQMCLEAPLAIVVCGDDRLEKIPGRWAINCAAAMQNLLLAAHALGYGAVWCGTHGIPERVAGMCHLLRLPPNVHPLGFIPIGVPAEQVPPEDRYRPDRVHQNCW